MDFKSTYTSFSVNKLEETKNFYVNNLEARVVHEKQDMFYLSITEHDFLIYYKNDHSPASYPVLNFEVYDMESALSELEEKGVVFDQYGTDYIKTDSRGIADKNGTKMAWFKDPSGNILSLIEIS